MFKSIRASLPQVRRVRGYAIKRLPLGGYLQAIESVKDAPRELLQTLFPGQSAAEILDGLRTIRPDGVHQLIAKAMTVAPGILLRLLSALTDIPEDRLRDDPDIGLDGLAEILQAFLEVNQVANFIQALGSQGQQLRSLYRQQTPGSSD